MKTNAKLLIAQSELDHWFRFREYFILSKVTVSKNSLIKYLKMGKYFTLVQSSLTISGIRLKNSKIVNKVGQ